MTLELLLWHRFDRWVISPVASIKGAVVAVPKLGLHCEGSCDQDFMWHRKDPGPSQRHSAKDYDRTSEKRKQGSHPLSCVLSRIQILNVRRKGRPVSLPKNHINGAQPWITHIANNISYKLVIEVSMRQQHGSKVPNLQRGTTTLEKTEIQGKIGITCSTMIVH